MANLLQQFVVDSLVPEGREQGRAYQLNETSVSPVRIIGRDRRGNPIEETICPFAKSAKFVDPDGNICDVPLRTGRVMSMSPESVMYENIVTSDLIRQGQIPLEACPHTGDFRSIVGYAGPLVPTADGKRIDSCNGAPGAQRLEEACEHMQSLVKERRTLAQARAREEDDKLRQMKPSDVADIVTRMGEAFGETMAAQMGKPTPAAAKKALREGQGEKVE
jgi:hypothetical protein